MFILSAILSIDNLLQVTERGIELNDDHDIDGYINVYTLRACKDLCIPR